MPTTSWRNGFHLMPPTGWMNDPNGLCQFRGVYHVFHQYSPAWPAPHAPRGWGHFTSTDLVHWTHHGMVISPDTPEDASGAYSGSAVVLPGAASDGGDLLRLYYTGNVKEPGAHDYIHTGRQANEIIIESEDGMTLSRKRVFMRNADYPSCCSCHVRDPKVWRQDGSWWMLLGARDVLSKGMVLVYRSDDGLSWELHEIVRPIAPFGFMWECPDRVELDGCEFLSFCPQGMQDLPWANGVRDQSGYLPLDPGVRLVDVNAVDPTRFRRWDAGFDFYAPQTFTDDAGRTLLIGWMGVPDVPFENAPARMTWCHCLTVPRVLARRADGGISQLPAPELESLRGAAVSFDAGQVVLDEHRADIVVDGLEGDFSLTLDGALEIAFRRESVGGALGIAFIGDAAQPDGAGSGRTSRTCPADALHTLRVLVDSSAVEVFANDGACVFATRWFPVAPALTIALEGTYADAVAYPMGDGMQGTYEPDSV